MARAPHARRQVAAENGQVGRSTRTKGIVPVSVVEAGNNLCLQPHCFLGAALLSVWLAASTSGLAGTILFNHDAAGRLTAANYGAGKNIGYTYDNADNITLRAVVVFLDTDNDSLDDHWETSYFGNLDRDGTGDFDGDGQSDLAEFLAGTLPNDGASLLHVIDESLDSGGLTLVWTSVAGRVYRVQFKNSLDDPAWSDLPGDVVAAGTRASKVDPTAGGLGRRFYRVMLVQ
jgi:YD repeat-containing protein